MHLLSISALWGALGCYACSIGLLFGPYKKEIIPYALLTCAWVLQALGLYAWGAYLGTCPLITPFEGYCFLSWALGLLTLIIGPIVRLEKLTTLGAGLSLLLGALAWTAKREFSHTEAGAFGFELHVALALLACSFFGILALCSILALLQDYALRKKRFEGFFESLPSFPQLGQINARLLGSGLGLYLAAGLGAAETLELATLTSSKWALIGSTSLGYTGLLVLGAYRGFWQKSFCWTAVGLFALMISLLGKYWA